MDPTALTSREMLLRGVRVHFFDGGPEGAPPLVMLHGFPFDARQWAEVAVRLARDFRVIALDFPGFGRSERPRAPPYTFSFESFSETTLDLTAALGLGRVTLVGHSMGAAVALVAATDRAEFVERLVIVAPPCVPTRSSLIERLALLPVLGRPMYGRFLWRSVARHREGTTSVLREATATSPGADLEDADASSSRDASYAMLRQLRDPSTLEARLPRVRCPALVLWGQNDPIYSWTHGFRVARELGGARLEILECGHRPEGERADVVSALIDSFASTTRRSTRDGTRPPRADRARGAAR